MYGVCDVKAVLSCLPIAQGCSEDLLEYCCERAVAWVQQRLKSEVREDNRLILSTMAAIAEYFLFLDGKSESDWYDTYSVGDLTFRRNSERELKTAKLKRNEAIAFASDILKDGDFYFTAT